MTTFKEDKPMEDRKISHSFETVTISTEEYATLIEESVRNDIALKLATRDPDGYVSGDLIRLVLGL